MSHFQRDAWHSSYIPTHDQDPVERRRLLNVLAQRRYRLRKRAKSLKNNNQISSEQSHSVKSTNNANEPVGTSGFTENLTDLSFGTNQFFEQFVQSSFSQVHQSPYQTFSACDPHEDEPTMIDNLRSDTGVIAGLDLFSAAALRSRDKYQLDSADYDSIFSVFPQDTSGSQIPAPTIQPMLSEATTLSDNSQLQPAPTSPFVDYAITTPGLSVICAKVDLFNHIVGPGFSLDIWDPAAISPICLGAVTRPCPPNFQPTHLQRNIQHHSFIDVLPWPSFRDRFLYTMSLPKELRPKIAQNDMPSVTLEIMMAAKDAGGGLRVWGSNAFLSENWEVGQIFYSKFWWALDSSILRRSNQHRERRGEGPLRFASVDRC